MKLLPGIAFNHEQIAPGDELRENQDGRLLTIYYITEDLTAFKVQECRLPVCRYVSDLAMCRVALNLTHFIILQLLLGQIIEGNY
jgi:hypothetical protein